MLPSVVLLAGGTCGDAAPLVVPFGGGAFIVGGVARRFVLSPVVPFRRM
jgi:hypothetical protein